MSERLEVFEKARKRRVSALKVLSSVPLGVDSYESGETGLKEYFPAEQIPSMYHLSPAHHNGETNDSLDVDWTSENKREATAFC